MSAPRRSRNLESLGVLASEHPCLAGDIEVLTEFVNAGHTVVDPNSGITDELIADAHRFGKSKAPDGHVLLARIGRRTRISERVLVKGEPRRIPSVSSSRGFVVVDGLQPVANWVDGLPSVREAMKWTLGSVAANVLRLGAKGLEETGAVLHLGQNALHNGLVVASADELRELLNGCTHPLSQQATDNKELAFAA